MRPNSLLKVSGSFGSVLLLALLVPFVVIGESWGMLWYPLALPFSAVLKGAFWSSSDSMGYLLVCSALTALSWTVVLYLCLMRLGRR